MNHQQPPREADQPERPEQPEARSGYDRHHGPWHERHLRQLRPRIWIASLADYNNGYLHGRWIDADQDPEHLYGLAQAILEDSPTPGAEEWAIHDYDDFPGVTIGEHESLEDVAAIAKGLAKHGPAFGAWTTLCRDAAGTGPLDHDLLAQFDEHYLGSYPTTADWMRQEAEELGLEETISKAMPEHLHPYIEVDYQALVRDLEMSGEVTFEEGEEGVWVFRQ